MQTLSSKQFSHDGLFDCGCQTSASHLTGLDFWQEREQNIGSLVILKIHSRYAGYLVAGHVALVLRISCKPAGVGGSLTMKTGHSFHPPPCWRDLSGDHKVFLGGWQFTWVAQTRPPKMSNEVANQGSPYNLRDLLRMCRTMPTGLVI